ncbi:MAG TPA: hypothetical protein VFJ43_13545 [Bacteroidia bacterium]|nr:hypothetical protein [Bacteroidia bacterium]
MRRIIRILFWKVFGKEMNPGADGIVTDKNGVRWISETRAQEAGDVYNLILMLHHYQMDDITDVILEAPDETLRNELKELMELHGFIMSPLRKRAIRMFEIPN